MSHVLKLNSSISRRTLRNISHHPSLIVSLNSIKICLSLLVQGHSPTLIRNHCLVPTLVSEIEMGHFSILLYYFTSRALLYLRTILKISIDIYFSLSITFSFDECIMASVFNYIALMIDSCFLLQDLYFCEGNFD